MSTADEIVKEDLVGFSDDSGLGQTIESVEQDSLNNKTLKIEPGLLKSIDDNESFAFPTITQIAFTHLYEEYVSRLYQPHYWRGILFPGMYFLPKVLQQLQDIEFQREDILIATYPRSGTTWTAEILSSIYSKDDLSFVETSDICTRVHHIEALAGSDAKRLETILPPRLFQTHLRYDMLPKSIVERGCKIIYVLRDPKDVVVSLYHHHRSATDLGNIEIEFAKFLPLFLEGKVVCGSWFDHVASYWEHRESPNVMIVRYEDMIEDLGHVIRGLSKFVGITLTERESKAISDHCSFKNMKDNKNVNRTWIPTFDSTKAPFMRKGIVGDWKNHFSPKECQIFDFYFKMNKQTNRALSDFNF